MENQSDLFYTTSSSLDQFQNNTKIYKNTQFVIQRNGIPKERVINHDKITIIEDLIKCSICLEILCKPYECEICGSLFCEDCINNWIKVNLSCPMKCQEFKMNKARPNTRKMLNLIKLRCINYPECSYINDYWEMFNHEKNCPFQKIKCPNEKCQFQGNYKELKKHIYKNCQFENLMCGFCYSLVPKCFFSSHFDEHKMYNTYTIQSCNICNNTNINNDNNSNRVVRCVCRKFFCDFCLKEGKNISCLKSCYIFDTGLSFTTQVYNISKYPLPRNFEIKLKFNSVDWIRTGITFDKSIINDQTDINCPPYDLYCILEDLVQFYTLSSQWKNVFSIKNRALKDGDIMIITLKNGEMRFEVNGADLRGFVKIDVNRKDNMYLFVHCRNEKSSCEIIYITEIFNSKPYN